MKRLWLAAMRQAGTQKISWVAALRIGLDFAEPGIPAEQQDIGAAKERLAQDDFLANSPKPTEYPASLYGSVNLPVLPSPNPIGEPPVPHTNGWQTALTGDAPGSAPGGEAQGALQLDSAP
jgi:hypothetical protein